MTATLTSEAVSGYFSKKLGCSDISEEFTTNGVSWRIQSGTELASFDSFNKIDLCPYSFWNFQWDEAELKEQGYDGFEGHVRAYYTDRNDQAVRHPFKVKLTRSGQSIRRRIIIGEESKSTTGRNVSRFLKMSFFLKKFSFQATRAASKFDDAVLVVDGNKIDVNKNHLSIHSEYFNTLFNSDFKEKSMTEIPIEDVKYADFVGLLDTFDPTHPIPPTDENVEILLELADRFAIPAVTVLVENFLLSNSHLPFKALLKLADKNKLDRLLEISLKSVVTEKHTQLLLQFSQCEDLSEATKAKILEHMVLLSRERSLFNLSV